MAVAAHGAFEAATVTYLKSNYQTRGAPHAPDVVTFDDFFLQMRVAREFAMVINDAYQLKVEDILHFDGVDQALLRKARTSGGGSEQDFRNCFYDHYFKRYQRWNDAAAISHASSYADQAVKLLR